MLHRPPPAGGFTLLEVATVLLVAAVLASTALPAGRRQLDRAAVRGAREAAVGMVSLARAEALAAGAAELRVDPGGDSLWVTVGPRVVRTLRLDREHGVDLGPPGASVRPLSFGFLGLGLAASRTLTFRRGGQETAVTVSSYGRIRRW